MRRLDFIKRFAVGVMASGMLVDALAGRGPIIEAAQTNHVLFTAAPQDMTVYVKYTEGPPYPEIGDVVQIRAWI